MSESVENRFLRYVKIDTQSQDDVEKVPSTDKQFTLANMLVEELKAIGLEDVDVDKHCYVMATLPASPGFEKKPVVGFIAHMDTSPEAPGGANPVVWKDYNGKELKLPKEDIVISPNENPELKNYVGQTIITSDGTSLLGADNKAGVAEIMTALELMVKDPTIKHGKIRIAFTPDEEVGKGTEFFDVDRFGAKFAYTIDGGELGEVENETFNAATAICKFKGYNVHPGYAKNKMRNSIRAAGYFITLLPEDMAPETTEGWEGYLHPNNFKGAVEETTIKVLIRDFKNEGMEEKKKELEAIKGRVNERYQDIDINLEIKESYKNMKIILDKHPHVMDMAFEACRRAGIEPKLRNIRGGTDGARLCFMGVPTPNIFAGGINFHGKKEFIPVQSMEKTVEVIIELAKLVSER
ncbi:MAG: peptidase T [Methanomassiliicoccales archaeon]|nr:MAG: peptidase T [Methanomassiliicoccales archaeon]